MYYFQKDKIGNYICLLFSINVTNTILEMQYYKMKQKDLYVKLVYYFSFRRRNNVAKLNTLK